MSQLKILVFATENTPLAARISIALASVGFGVATLTPDVHPVRQARNIRDHFAYHPRSRLKSIVRAIDLWSPDFLVCTDDLAVRQLQTLHQRTTASDDKAGRRIADLIELSLGPSTSFSPMRNKSDFLTLAELEGLRCPRTIVYPASRAFPSPPAELTYPIVVKADHSEGGRCVRIVNGAADLRAAVWELQTPSTWRARRFFGAILGSESLSPLRLPLRRTISLQQYVVGRPANRAVICWKGKVLAGTSVEAVEVSHEHGPASVVRLIDHLEMATVAERIVKRLHLSGFVGFDFVLDFANRAWLLEMNPRVTPICHFSLANGTNLAGSLYTQMSGQPPSSSPATIHRDLIALFPDGVIRSPFSNYLESCQQDIPRDEPELVGYVLDQHAPTGILSRARAFVEHRFPAVAAVLVRLGLIGAHGNAIRHPISTGDDSPV
jgi:glutathione synthase/RimK-type ligase-like ATP-grasp enzyme